MPTATAEKPKKKTKAPAKKGQQAPVASAPQKGGHDGYLNCKFRGVSIGKTAHYNFGVTFDVSVFKDGLNGADKLLTGSRLSCMIEYDPNAADDADGQPQFFTDNMIELEINGESTGFGKRFENVNVTLKVHKDETHIQELEKFAYHAGRIKLKRVGKVEKRQAADDD